MKKIEPWWNGKTPPIVYHYTVDTKEWIDAAPADPSPREPGVWLLPGHATFVAPPPTGQNEAAVFKDGAWSKVPDHRGEVWWQDHRFVQVLTLGDPKSWGCERVVVHDAEYYLPEGAASAADTRIHMWVNDDEIGFPDDPNLIERKVLAGWEAQGETIRSMSYDMSDMEPEPELTPEEIEKNNADAAALLEAQIDARVRKMLESGSTPPEETQP